MTKLYYECHITIEPVFDAKLEWFKQICRDYRFHVADLLFQKRTKDTPERSRVDSFCTGRSKDLDELTGRMLGLLTALWDAGFKVWRYKIEDTVLDSRYGDEVWPLDRSILPDKERDPRPMVDPPELPSNWFDRKGRDDDENEFTYCNAMGPERAHCIGRMGHSYPDHTWAWFTVEDRTKAETEARALRSITARGEAK